LIVRSFDCSCEANQILSIFKDEPYVFLLESSKLNNVLGRYSFIGFDPFFVFKCDGPLAFERLRKACAKYFGTQIKKSKATPFPSGIMGYLSYDLGLPLEGIRRKTEKDACIPDGLFGFYDRVLTLDHKNHKLIIASSGLPEKNISLRKKRASRRYAYVIKKIKEHSFCSQAALEGQKKFFSRDFPLTSNFTKKSYLGAVKKALDYIRRGDIYQVNLSQQFCLDAKGMRKHTETFQIYQHLKKLSPSCFSAYFDAKAFQIISSSPELFLRVRNKMVQTRPMKGTRQRGEGRLQDKREERSLLESAKDKAELLMITDLERNDLGRVCQPGSIRVQEMRTLEKYKTVFQTTSTVAGKLKKNKDGFDLLKASFPGGSITGCPKIRAMQIIEELEPVARSIYTGSLGYISAGGDMDFNILIRTLLVKNEKIYFHVGGGIVADSLPLDEYNETLIKARAMRNCLSELFKPGQPKEESIQRIFWDGRFLGVNREFLDSLVPGVLRGKGVFETMLASGGRIFLLKEHLDRFFRGLKTCGIRFPFTQKVTAGYLREALKENRLKNARIRLSSREEKNELHTAIVASPYRPPSAHKRQEGYSLMIASSLHKRLGKASHVKSIAYRKFLDAYQEAQEKGCEEAVFLNRNKEVVEGSRSNIFLVKKGKLYTPGLQSGCLDGIARRQVFKIAHKYGIECKETRVKYKDLLSCDEAFLTNSLIEVMPIKNICGQKIGKGKSRPITSLLLKIYRRSAQKAFF